jgi:hypothetical protein
VASMGPKNQDPRSSRDDDLDLTRHEIMTRRGVTSAVSPCDSEYSSLPALHLMVETAITRKPLAATSSSWLALLVI